MRINTMEIQLRNDGWGKKKKKKEQQPSKSDIFLQKGHDVTEFQMIVAAFLRLQALDDHLAHFTSKITKVSPLSAANADRNATLATKEKGNKSEDITLLWWRHLQSWMSFLFFFYILGFFCPSPAHHHVFPIVWICSLAFILSEAILEFLGSAEHWYSGGGGHMWDRWELCPRTVELRKEAGRGEGMEGGGDGV